FFTGYNLSMIGFQVGISGVGTQTGTLNLWLKNTSDLSYTLGPLWETTGFTLVSSIPAFTVPTSGYCLIPFVNGSTFTYTGGGVYVAWEFSNPSGSIGTSKLYPLTNSSPTSLCCLYSSPTVMGTTMTASTSRPATFFYGTELLDIVQVTNIYTTERVPASFGTPTPVTVRVFNISVAPLTFDATLTVVDSATLTVRYLETKTVTVPANSALRATFTGWTPTIQENVKVTVSTSVIPGETIIDNNTKTIPANVNNNLYSYHYSRVYINKVGFSPSGIFATKFAMNGTGLVQGANVWISNFPGNIGNTVYAVLMDSTGLILTQTPNYILSAGDLGKNVSFTFPAPYSLSNQNFLVGLAVLPGIGGQYYPLGTSDESPIRYSTFYITFSLAGGSLSAASSKHGIEAVLIAPPTVLTTAATPILDTGATLNGTVNANDRPTNVSFQYGITPAYGSTITASPSLVSGTSANPVNALLTGLIYNTIYHYRVIGTNLGGTTYGLDQSFRTGCSLPAGAAGPITGPAIVCASAPGQVYSVVPVGNAVGYVWTLPPGAVNTAGAGTNIITVTFGPLSGGVTVAGISAGTCENGASSGMVVDVKPSPAPVIGSSNTPCSGSTGNIYYTESGMTGYLWNVSAGGTIVSGQGTDALNVTWNGTGAQTVSVIYTGTNGCASQEAVHTIFVNPLPAAAGSINGTSVLCAGTNGVAYSCNPILNADFYEWTLPGGAAISSGAGTRNIIVDFGTAATGGNISVAGSNSCGNGVVSPVFNVTVNSIPATPLVEVNGAVLTSSALSGNQWYFEGTLIPGATGQSYTVSNNTGYFWCRVTVNGCSSAASNKVWVVVIGVDEQITEGISVYPSPNNGQFTVRISSNTVESWTIEVYDQYGAQHCKINDLVVNGSLEKQIDLQTAGSGLYTVAFINNSHRIIKKIIISR
ncbi:MAG: T9SS type A sorting domain-containing protein, partial [Bacteroidota bacterium]